MRWYNFAVSIHALLAECDYTAFPVPASELCFNPRTPCGVRRATLPPPLIAEMFQSTHSLRSATGSGVLSLVLYAVSIHALLAECDSTRAHVTSTQNLFQSTHSLRSATGAVDVHSPDYYVSIHALLAECDT